MEAYNTDLALLDKQLAAGNRLCCSGGIQNRFPKIFYGSFLVEHIGIIVCHRGSFCFASNGIRHEAKQGETVFLTRGSYFHIEGQSYDLGYSLIFYSSDSIRDLLGSTIAGMRLLEIVNPTACTVWHTGHEEDLLRYSELLSSAATMSDSNFNDDELTLLMLSLTYRLCDIFCSRTFGTDSAGRKMDIYAELMRLISKHYHEERSVRFYAEKLCLSPKYLTQMVKSVSGCTVQQLVFKAITKRAIFLIMNTDKTIKEISDSLSFPNPSAFGTFFKKQVGMSPVNYRVEKRGK